MSNVRSIVCNIVVSDMGKIASKMLQFSSKQGEDMKMDVDIITNNKHGLTDDEESIDMVHDKKKMKLMVDGESFTSIKVMPRRSRRLRKQPSIVFTEGQEEEEICQYKHKQSSAQAAEPKAEVQVEENARGDVEDSNLFSTAQEGDTECAPVPELPVEILNSVFDYVKLEDRCVASMVSKYWNVAAWLCVTNMEFNLRHRPEQDQVIASIFRKCPNIRHVTLRDCFGVSGRVLRQLPATVQSLQFFNCPNLMKTISNEDLKFLPSDMMTLSLKNCDNISDEGVAFLPSSMKHLELSGSKITDAGLSKLPRALRSLVLSRSQNPLKALAALPDSLVSLDLSYCTLEAEAFEGIPQSLVSLNLTGCITLVDQHLEQLSSCSELQTLMLENNPSVTVKGIEGLPSSLKSLSIKNCAGINDRAVAAIPRGLKEFTLWKCKNVTKLAFTRLPSTLVTLKLVHTAITDESVGMLPDTLTRLSLFGCSQVSDTAVSVLPSSLNDLDLSWTSVTDAGLTHLTKLTKLTKVNLSNSKVSREGIIVLENNQCGLTVVKGFCE